MSPPAPEQDRIQTDPQADPTTAARADVAKQGDATVMADTPHALTPEKIQDMQYKNQIVKIDRGSITQDALNSDPVLSDAANKDLPVYVMPGVGETQKGASVVDLGNGKKAIIINEGIHNWDADYVEKHIRHSTADIAANKELTPAEKYTPANAEEKQRYDELTKHITDTAQKNGLGETHVIISTEPGVQNAYSFQSKEGVNYVVIPKKEMDNSVSSQEMTNNLEKTTDAMIPDMKQADSSQAATIEAHKGNQYIASQTDRDGGNGTPNTQRLFPVPDPSVQNPPPYELPQLSQQSLDEMVKEKVLIKVKASEVPGLTDGDGKPYPPDTQIYVAPGANSDYRGQNQVLPGQTTDPEHKNYVIVDMSQLKQSPEYVKEHVMASDADVAQSQVNGTLTKLDPEMAKKMHVPEGVQIMVNNDPNTTDPYSFQTKEGKNYIILTKEDVDAAKAHGNVQEIQHQVDLQKKIIDRGDNTAEGIVRSNEAAKWMAQNVVPDKDTGRYTLPSQATNIDNATLNNLEKTHTIEKLKPEDMTPGTAAAIAGAKDADGKPLPADTPVYVMNGINSDGIDPQAGQVMKTSEGKYFILVNESARKWTPDNAGQAHDITYKNNTATPSHPDRPYTASEDALHELQKTAKTPQEAAEMQRRYDALTKGTQGYADNMGVGNQVILVSNATSHPERSSNPTGESSIETKEGTKYIFISREQFNKAMQSDDALKETMTVMGHETSHNAHKDSSVESGVASHDIRVQREHEMRAELGGEGPLGYNNPLARANVYEKNMLQEYNDAHSGEQGYVQKTKLSDKELAEISQNDIKAGWDPEHPTRWEQIQALRHEDMLMKRYEADYVKKHGHAISDEPPEMQKQIRAAEAKQVEDQTIVYMKDHLQPRDEKPKIANENENLPPQQQPAQQQAAPDPAPQQDKPLPPIVPPPPPPDAATQNPPHADAKPGDPKPDQSASYQQAASSAQDKVHPGPGIEGLEHAVALFRLHSQNGAHHVDPTVAGFAPHPVVVSEQSQQRTV